MITDLMIDLETLATTPDAAILTIGAVKFDPYGDEDMEQFYVKVDIDSCASLDLTVDDNTIEWWSKQNSQAQEEAFGLNNRIDINDAMYQLYKFAWGTKRVWSHGAGFDIIICEHIFRKIKRACPWNYWQVRDTRTLFDIGFDPEMNQNSKHHALYDAIRQARGVQNVFKKLTANCSFLKTI